MKLLMAASGALFVFYVLAHMYGNLKILGGQEGFDEYAHHLRTMFMPILPYGGFLWLFRLLLLVALVVHLYSAFTLWARAKGARPDRYLAKEAAKKTLKTKMMRWGGVTLLLFIIFHLIHFTIAKVNFNGAYSAQQLEVNGVESPYKLVVASFQLWWVVLIYLIALAALGMHLFHGVWSAAQTFGLTSSAGKRAAYKGLGHLIAAVVVIGFAIPPLAVLFGIAK